VIRSDNGPEFLGEAFVQWLKQSGVVVDDRLQRGAPHDSPGDLTPCEFRQKTK
jgi:hypothetical protein